MSRTYRRKNSQEEAWMISDYIIQDDDTIVRVAPIGKHRQHEIAMYHSDNPRWCYGGSVGKYGKQIFVRGMRVKNKEILGRAVRELNDEPMFIPYVHPYR